MKTNNILKLLLCLPLFGMLWSCTSDLENDFLANEHPLLLSAVIEKMDAPSLRSVADIGNTGVFVSGATSYSNAKYTGIGGTLTPIAQGYWGSTNDISIYAYAPYQSTEPTVVAIKTDQTANADYTASDFLYAPPATFTFANRNDISLTFNHHLSKINLTLVAGEGISTSDLATAVVQITGTNTETSINIANGTLSTWSNMQAITTKPDGVNKYKAIVIPQTVATGTSLFEVTIDARSFAYALPAEQLFVGGKQYNYTLTIAQGGITVSPVEIATWTEEVKENDGTATVVYRVGDYYPSPNDASTAKGIVFWIDPASSGAHGKIVSLDETSLNWSTALTWCTNKGGAWVLPAKNELQYLYCAYNGKKPETWNNGTPSWNADQTARDTFNGKLTDAAGDALSNNYHWSLSEVVNSSAWVVHFADGSTDYGGKVNDVSVRAVSAF